MRDTPQSVRMRGLSVSEKEGQRMIKQNIKLVLRAFNGECEGARGDVSWNNITKMRSA